MISPSSEHFFYVGAHFLDSVSVNIKSFLFSTAIDNANEIFYTNELYTFPGRMLLIRKDSIKKKYQNDSPTSMISPKKLIKKWYIFIVGKPIDIDCRTRILRSSLWKGL